MAKNVAKFFVVALLGFGFFKLGREAASRREVTVTQSLPASRPTFPPKASLASVQISVQEFQKQNPASQDSHTFIRDRLAFLRSLENYRPSEAGVSQELVGLYTSILKRPENWIVHRQALRNLKPYLARMPAVERREIFKSTDPATLAAAARSDRELLEELGFENR